jgi:hypothetical protein
MKRNRRRRVVGVGAAVGIAMALGAGPVSDAQAECVPVSGLGNVCVGTSPGVVVGAYAVVQDFELLKTGETGAKVDLACLGGTYQVPTIVAVANNVLSPIVPTGIAC